MSRTTPRDLREAVALLLGYAEQRAEAAVAKFTAGGLLDRGTPNAVGATPVSGGGTGHTGGAEPPLGNPDGDYYVLVSTAAGVRSWATPGGGGGGASDAVDVTYDPTASGLAATDVQAALDEIAAGGGGGALVRIAQVVVTVAGPTISFTSIPGTYEDLILAWQCRTTAMADDFVRAQFNGDTGAHYNYAHYHTWYNSQAAGGQGGANSIRLGLTAADNNGNAANPGQMETTIIGYARTTWHKTTRGIGSVGFASPDIISLSVAGEWTDTAAITQIDLFSEQGANFKIGSVFTLYGRT